MVPTINFYNPCLLQQQAILLCFSLGISTALKIQDLELNPDKNGLYRIDDMLLNEDQMKQFYGHDDEVASRQAVAKQWRWTNNVMPYKIDSSVGWDKYEKKRIKESIQDLNAALTNCFEIR